MTAKNLPSDITPAEALGILCLHVSAIILKSEGDTSPQLPTENCGRDHFTVHRDETLMKKFSTKRIPAISLEHYLLRLHEYCPMSTAVYLATSWYITRMAIIERIILVAPNNAHRLVLGGLRVAAKALEDLQHSHNRFSKVGGVTETELTRLEINFCYLMDFDLKINDELLSGEISLFQERCNIAFPKHCAIVD
ncbi:hypothetical protein LOY94_001876 [Ophidiomyces ophidiicola]|nr:hypothetical protein LOY94_001876 [Ophidiomyces ophidiicola]